MQRQPVNSSNLASVGYDPGNETLEIEFRNGTIYRYLNVPTFEHDRLMSATSHGVYFNANIRDVYSFERA
jgi:hypothetical protein